MLRKSSLEVGANAGVKLIQSIFNNVQVPRARQKHIPITLRSDDFNIGILTIKHYFECTSVRSKCIMPFYSLHKGTRLNQSASKQLSMAGYSKTEEMLNSVSHGVGFIFAVIGLVYLLIRSDTALSVTSSAIYGTSLSLMFLASTIYHSVESTKLKTLFKLFDHSAIYLLIAGTYTPFLLVGLGGWIGWTSIVVIWLIAVFGVTFKCFVRHRFPKLSVITYLTMGWLAVVLIYPLYQNIPGAGMWLLFAGGLCFSIGVMFYVAKNVKFTHAVWHLFVIAGCACHYFSIYHYVI